MKVVFSLVQPFALAAVVALSGLMACEKANENNDQTTTANVPAPTAETSPPAAPKPDTPALKGATTLTIAVEGMVCGGCEQAIGDRVGAMEGVTSCVADHKAGTAQVVFDPTKTDATKIAGTIDALGYKAKVTP